MNELLDICNNAPSSSCKVTLFMDYLTFLTDLFLQFHGKIILFIYFTDGLILYFEENSSFQNTYRLRDIFRIQFLQMQFEALKILSKRLCIYFLIKALILDNSRIVHKVVNLSWVMDWSDKSFLYVSV